MKDVAAIEESAIWPEGSRPPRRAVVAMSGGVDSAFAAWWLVQHGVSVIGLHFKTGDFFVPAEGAPRCCSVEEARSARRVAERLGIPFYMISVKKDFREKVIMPFLEAYGQGLTPNPCLWCNPLIKWRFLLQKARELGAEAMATGHHARVIHHGTEDRLLRGVDKKKDQSYFLYGLSPQQLRSAVLPAGWFTKNQVRKLLREAGFPIYTKPESQDICFAEPGGYAATVEKYLGPRRPPEGEIVDQEGRVLGRHPGIHHFTIGQRKGLGIASAEPLYVIAIDPRFHRLVVGPWAETYRKDAVIGDLHWITDPPAETEMVRVKVRYKSPLAPCRIILRGDRARIIFEKAQRAIAPGQAAVIYRHDQVLGGGLFQPEPPAVLQTAGPSRTSDRETRPESEDRP